MNGKKRERLVAHTFANYPSLINQLRQISLDKNVSVSKLIREALF